MASEWSLIRALVRGPFRDAAVLVPNVTRFGGEIDLCIIKPNLKLIDCEVKISRSDLFADAKKDKWWFRGQGTFDEELRRYTLPDKTPLEWPRYAWKHYYAMPESIWSDDLLQKIKPMSGIILMREDGSIKCRRSAKPSPAAKPMSERNLLAMCRLATLRMWDALGRSS